MGKKQIGQDSVELFYRGVHSEYFFMYSIIFYVIFYNIYCK